MIVSQMQKGRTVAKEPRYPLVFASAYSQQTGDGFAVAASDIIPLSRLLRSCATLWLANHQWLMSQGFSPLEATRRLLAQTEGKQPEPQPSFAPQPAPSPFAQEPMKVAANGR
jgi:hypothetical protein